MLKDRFEQPLSSASDDAVAHYVTGLDCLLSANLGAEQALDAALRADPDFALAHIARARALQMAAHGPEAQQAAATARRLAGTCGERERSHIEIVALGVEGRGAEAFAALNAHLVSNPRDALPLSLALGVYGLFGFSGRADHHAAQRDLLERLAPHWDPDWWFLTYLGWSHVETGNCSHGIDLLERALAGNPHNAHAAHARAHGYYETGEAEAGAQFIAAWLPTYDSASPLHCHIAWHLALFALHLGDTERAAAVYNAHIQPSVSQAVPMFTLIDNAAFLWRAQIYGQPSAPAADRATAEYARQHFPDAGLAFVNVHTAMALAAAGDYVASTHHLESVEALVVDDRQPPGPVVSTICAGITAFGRGDYGVAADDFAKSLHDLDRIGGSHAQRDVVIDSLIAAHLRAGQPDKARDVVTARAQERAPHLDQDWLGRVSAALN